jgi:hypothetical protein
MEIIFNIFLILLGIASCLAITSLIVLILIAIVNILMALIESIKE